MLNRRTADIFLLFVLAGTNLFAAESPTNKNEPPLNTTPNIIVIMADDLGYADLSFLSQSPADVATPHIDQLADEGTYFSNAYATAPICSPSRCGMITGRYQQRWGNYWYGQGGLPNEEHTLPQALKKLGFYSKKIGKTHLNGGPAEHPLDHGFDESIGFMHHTWDYIRLDQKDLDAYKERAAGKPLGLLNVGPLERGKGEPASYENGFTTEIFTDEAIKLIEAHQESDTPFYIQLEHNAVHMPTYIADPDYARKAGYAQPVWDRTAEKWEFPFWDPNESTWDQWHKNWGHLGKVDSLGRKRYLANLIALDDSVGRVMKTLKQTGQRDNTIVVFLSDNGGTINTYSNNTPLRGFKYMFGEGGVRIPMIVSWPKKLPRGDTRGHLVSAMDIFPTLVELAGGEPPKNLDGRSLLPIIKSSSKTEKTTRNDNLGHDHLCFSDGKKTWSIRTGDWKLIASPGWVHSSYQLNAENIAEKAEDVLYPNGVLLFNLKDDIGETTNLAGKNPERVKTMQALYDAWRAEMSEPVRGTNKKKNGNKRKANKASSFDLETPPMTDEAPAAGKRVRQVATEYQGTDVHHSLYLPIDWDPSSKHPVIVEYTGNEWPACNSTGKVEDANLGYGITGGKKWSYPESDRESAIERLSRLNGRPVLVCGTKASGIKSAFLKEQLKLAQFTFLDVPVSEIFKIPTGKIIHPHTDLWMHQPSVYRHRAREWLSQTCGN